MSIHRLQEINGDLHFDDSTDEGDGFGPAMLLARYPEGDCDTIKWPNPNEDHVRRALFDAREVGHLEHDALVVELPDGTSFPIDG